MDWSAAGHTHIAHKLLLVGWTWIRLLCNESCTAALDGSQKQSKQKWCSHSTNASGCCCFCEATLFFVRGCCLPVRSYKHWFEWKELFYLLFLLRLSLWSSVLKRDPGFPWVPQTQEQATPMRFQPTSIAPWRPATNLLSHRWKLIWPVFTYTMPDPQEWTYHHQTKCKSMLFLCCCSRAQDPAQKSPDYDSSPPYLPTTWVRGKQTQFSYGCAGFWFILLYNIASDFAITYAQPS